MASLKPMRQPGLFVFLSLFLLPLLSLQANSVCAQSAAAENSPLRLALPGNRQPAAYLVNGKPEGFTVRLLEQIFSDLGIPVHTSLYPNYGRIIPLLSSGEIDVLTTFKLNDEYRGPYFEELMACSSQPYASYDWGGYVLASSLLPPLESVQELENYSVATVRDVGTSYLPKIDTTRVMEVNSTDQLVKLLAHGRVQIIFSTGPQKRLYEQDHQLKLRKVLNFPKIEAFLCLSRKTIPADKLQTIMADIDAYLANSNNPVVK